MENQCCSSFCLDSNLKGWLPSGNTKLGDKEGSIQCDFFFVTLNKLVLVLTLDYMFLCVEVLIFSYKILGKFGRDFMGEFAFPSLVIFQITRIIILMA